MKQIRIAQSVGLPVLRRPDLWMTLLRLVARLIPNRWWRNGPWPSRDYLEYRGRAVYGMPLSSIPASEFLAYLEWCKTFPAPIR